METDCVVVLTSPDGRRMLASADLMSAEAAEYEAAKWRRAPHAGPWTAEVRKVVPLPDQEALAS